MHGALNEQMYEYSLSRKDTFAASLALICPMAIWGNVKWTRGRTSKWQFRFRVKKKELIFLSIFLSMFLLYSICFSFHSIFISIFSISTYFIYLFCLFHLFLSIYLYFINLFYLFLPIFLFISIYFSTCFDIFFSICFAIYLRECKVDTWENNKWQFLFWVKKKELNFVPSCFFPLFISLCPVSLTSQKTHTVLAS